MKPRLLIFPIAFALFNLLSCNKPTGRGRVIVVQPFLDFSAQSSKRVFDELKLINPNTILRKPISLPPWSYNPERGRYRADSLINYLRTFGSADTVIIGLTGKDISTTKGNIKDWGVMGLGFEPGNACVVSVYRLSEARLESQFYKLALHELGHTQGLPHCPNTTCLMRDAEGSNHLEAEIGFCPSCRVYLESKGWKLN